MMFIIPALTGLIAFVSRWHARGSSIEISNADVGNLKKKIGELEQKLDTLIEKFNEIIPTLEVFKYRLGVLEKVTNEHDDKIDELDKKSTQSHQSG